ncbi:hypothetical protein [Phaeobacter porticola]|uniref:Stress response protein n=1 Tax=Phaeobacter porticola TaxID=1844006 RepID=A0A1L3I287_9RHOB|nr:hypothetical protein [Phaeobacter porticola]APG46226.1 putative proteins involved in stress response, homologs of TerZ and putative cAMP-binding protein CABP1 [Phaeobacter porticola]
MSEELPEFLTQGEQARLFPVLSTTSKEGRTTSIVLACLAKVDEFGASLLASLGQRVGVRSKIETYTEVVCTNRASDQKDRPDGLIVMRTGSREWRALVEAKVGSNNLDADQIEKYRQLAKDNEIDCVISISNQFATTPSTHPVSEVNKSRSKIPVYHWSWMHILTEVDLLLSRNSVSDMDQRVLLNELRRFLTHESAGVKGFDRMPKEWGELNKLVSSGGIITAKSADAHAVITAWHQETRDLSLILSRMTEAYVAERLPRKYLSDGALRFKDELNFLRENRQLHAELDVPDAAAPIKVVVDISRRSVDVGMVLRAPEDKVSTRARVNWILRQVKADKQEDLYLRLMWPGKSEPTQHLVSDLKENSDAAAKGKDQLSPHSFFIFRSKQLGARFAQQANFIIDLEEMVPAYYRDVGANLSAWQKRAPRIKEDRSTAEDVTTEAISEDAQNYDV